MHASTGRRGPRPGTPHKATLPSCLRTALGRSPPQREENKRQREEAKKKKNKTQTGPTETKSTVPLCAGSVRGHRPHADSRPCKPPLRCAQHSRQRESPCPRGNVLEGDGVHAVLSRAHPEKKGAVRAGLLQAGDSLLAGDGAVVVAAAEEGGRAQGTGVAVVSRERTTKKRRIVAEASRIFRVAGAFLRRIACAAGGELRVRCGRPPARPPHLPGRGSAPAREKQAL